MPGRDATAWTKRGSGCAPALLGAGGCLAPNRRYIDLDRWGSSASGGLSATGVSGDTQTLRSSVAGGEALNRERRGRSARMRRSRRLPQTHRPYAQTACPPPIRTAVTGRVATPRGCRTRQCVPPRANAYAEGWAAEPAQLAVDLALAPGRVLARRPQHQLSELRGDRWPARARSDSATADGSDPDAGAPASPAARTVHPTEGHQSLGHPPHHPPGAAR